MKKIFTLCLALFCAVATFAQDEFNPKGSFVFTDKDGNVYEDGAVITCADAVEDDFGEVQVSSGLYVKKVVADVEGSPLYVGMGVKVSNLENGAVQYCFPGSCHQVSKVGEYDVDKSDIKIIQGGESIMTEWIPGMDDDDVAMYGQATATFTLYAYENFGSEKKPDFLKYEEPASSITVNFIYSATAINGVADNAKASVDAIYTADGTRVQNMQKGLNIVKLSNGKTVKIVKK